MIEQTVTIIFGVAVGSLIGTWLGSKLMARNLVGAIQKVVESEELRASLNKRAEELGASLARGAKTELKNRFDFISVPEIETES